MNFPTFRSEITLALPFDVLVFAQVAADVGREQSDRRLKFLTTSVFLQIRDIASRTDLIEALQLPSCPHGPDRVSPLKRPEVGQDLLTSLAALNGQLADVYETLPPSVGRAHQTC